MKTLGQIIVSLTRKGFAHLKGREDRMQAAFCRTALASDATSLLLDFQSQGSL